MASPPVVVLDANLLYPFHLRNLLVQFGVDAVIAPRWTARIHEEWIGNLVATGRVPRERLLRTRDLMDRVLPEAEVQGWEARMEGLALPDPGDRHVLAAALAVGARTILTMNLRDFPEAALALHGLSAAHPDAFLCALHDADPEVLLEPSGNRHVWYFDPLGKTRLEVQDYGYDASGSLRLNLETASAYDGQSRLTKVILPEGNRTETTYDIYSNPLIIRQVAKSGTDALTQEFTYVSPLPAQPNFRRVATAKDARDNITDYEYTPGTGTLAKVTLPAVTKPGVPGMVRPVQTFTYTAVGLVQQETDAEGRVTSYEYDVANGKPGDLIARTVDAGTGRLNLKTTWTYDAVGNALTTVSPRGNAPGATPADFTTTSTYDAKRRLTRVEPAAFRNSTRYTYDADDRVTQVRRLVAPASGGNPAVYQVTTTAYTRTGKVFRVTDADGVRVTNTYDVADRLRFATSSSGRRVAYTYDVLSRITVVTDQVSGTVDPSIVSVGSVVRERRSYTRNGLLLTSRDGNDNTTRLFYDGFDRLRQTQFADGVSETYRYDANGNMTRRTTRAGEQINATFDALNRLLTRSVPANAHAAAVDYTYGYDRVGRLLQVQQSIDPQPIVYAYDTAGRLTAEQHPDGKVIGLAVDADGNRTGLTWPESGTQAYQVTYIYDELDRMTRVFEGADATGPRLASFAYDLLSQRASASYNNDVTSTWTHRLNGTLASVQHGFGGGLGVTFGYLYNTENAVRARQVSDAAYLPGPTNPALQVGTRAYGAATALNQYPSVGGVALSYDANGNLTGDGTWSFGYDAQNRLVAATKPGTVIGYGYDAAGRRRSRTVNGVTTSFLSVGEQEIAEYDAAGALVRRFVWGPGLDELVATVNAAGSTAARRRFHHADGLGSVVAVTDRFGAVEERFVYTPFGVGDSLAGASPWRFTGRRQDPDTGFYYLRARDYAPLLGRFLQLDPIGRQGGLNLYVYVENDPLNKTDPRGLFAPFVIGGLVGAPPPLDFLGHALAGS